jgi:actin-like ATPase involved in cell morphogenesis
MAKISINMKAGSVLHDENTIIGIDLGTTNSLVAYIKNDIAVTMYMWVKKLNGGWLPIRLKPFTL